MTASATYQFAGKTILITGGAGDIGKATAHRFAANGAGVVLLDLNQTKMADVVQELQQYHVPIDAFHCDVTSVNSVAQAFSQAVTQCKRIDYIFNNAGYQGVFAKTDNYPEDDFQKVIDINVIGVFTFSKLPPSIYVIQAVVRLSIWRAMQVSMDLPTCWPMRPLSSR